MFRCQKCDKVVKPRLAAQKRVIKERVRDYPVRPYAKKEKKLEKGKYKWVWIEDKGGTGREIVQEISCCLECAAEFDKHSSTI